MAFPVIVYNASSGSDTAASGAGPATALTGSGAISGDGAGGGTQTEIDLSADTPDLSGVATDGSDAIYLATGSGERHLFRITAVNDTTDIVTVDTAPDTSIDTGSAVSWAIGGKRQTLVNDTSGPDWDDIKSGWTFQFEEGTYDVGALEIENAELGADTTEWVTWEAAPGASSMPIITKNSGTNVRLINHDSVSGYLKIAGLNLVTPSSWVGSAVVRINVSGAALWLEGCKLECTNASGGASILQFQSAPSAGIIINNEITGYAAMGAEVFGSRPAVYFEGNWIHDIEYSAGNSIGVSFSSLSSFTSSRFCRNIVSGMEGDGINAQGQSSSSLFIIEGNTVYGNGGDGIEVLGTVTESPFIVRNNIMVSNGGYGLNVSSATAQGNTFADYNAFYNNTSGEITGISNGGNDVTLTGDPFTDSANDDYSLNATAGAGAACHGVGYPGVFAGGLTTGYLDIGAAQHQDSGGGGGDPFPSQGIQHIGSGIAA